MHWSWKLIRRLLKIPYVLQVGNISIVLLMFRNCWIRGKRRSVTLFIMAVQIFCPFGSLMMNLTIVINLTIHGWTKSYTYHETILVNIILLPRSTYTFVWFLYTNKAHCILGFWLTPGLAIHHPFISVEHAKKTSKKWNVFSRQDIYYRIIVALIFSPFMSVWCFIWC